MTILRIESVVFGVEDLELSIRFLDDWGLEKIETGTKGAVYATPENQPIVLRHMDDPELPPAVEAGSTAREVVWGVDSQEALEVIGSELSSDRDVTTDKFGGLHTADEHGFGIAFRIADISNAETETPIYNIGDEVSRLNARHWPGENARPLRLCHVVFSVPAEGHLEAARFYIDRLNFRISDQTGDGGTFMRADGATYHHMLYLLHRADRKGWNHFAFETNDFDEFMALGTRFSEKGWKTESGPGRHSLGSNWFWYFHSPLGGSIEYFADMDHMDDDWEPRFWDEAPPYARWMLGDKLIRY